MLLLRPSIWLFCGHAKVKNLCPLLWWVFPHAALISPSVTGSYLYAFQLESRLYLFGPLCLWFTAVFLPFRTVYDTCEAPSKQLLNAEADRWSVCVTAYFWPFPINICILPTRKWWIHSSSCMEKKEAFLHSLPLRMLLFLYQPQNYSCKQGKTLEMEVKVYVRILNQQQKGQ